MRVAVLLCMLASFMAEAQIEKEGKGYFANPIATPSGILFTNNYASAIYLSRGGTIEELLSAPGCGSYYVQSFEGNEVGLKLIDEKGYQSPVLLDLRTRKIKVLSPPSPRAGQVSFTRDGRVAYTLGEQIVVSDGMTNRRYDLGAYANLAPISPDGRFVAYNDGDDQIWLLDLTTDRKRQISDNRSGYFNPSWSPNGALLLFSGLNGKAKVFDIEKGTTCDLGESHHPSWSPDSRRVVFYRKEMQGDQLVNADLFVASSDGSWIRRLTNTTDVCEMDPSFLDGGDVIYHTFDRRTIAIASLPAEGGALQKGTREIVSGSAQPIQMRPVSRTGQEQVKTALDIPYVHQAYDTPDWFNGGWACAPAQAIMLIAYYSILPKWPTPCSTPTFHYNDWGNYVAGQYHFRQVDYVAQASDASGRASWGGYGYMWTGSYSPHSRMADYLRNHGMSAIQSEATPYNTAFAEVSGGHPLSMCVMLTSAGHLVLAHGIGAEPHTFVFNDPWGDKNRGYMNYYGKNVSYDWPGYNNGYQSLTEIAWCIATRYTPPEVSDTVVDDSQFGRGFFLNTTLPASMTLWKDMNSGYGGHAWFTYTRSGEPDNRCYAVWMPLLPQGGVFEVSAYIPSFGDASEATYQVSHGGGVATVVINQADHRDSWVSLGTYSFFQGNGGSVRLGDTSSVAGQVIAFDAVRWSYKGITSADYPRAHQIPSEYILYQNYPNPFNPSTVLRYFLPLESTVRLQIVDALGRVVATPVDGKQTPGLHELEWKPSGLSSGFYFVRMRAVGVNGSSAYADTKKILMMR